MITIHFDEISKIMIPQPKSASFKRSKKLYIGLFQINKSEFARIRTAYGEGLYIVPINFDIIAFKTVQLPVSRNLLCQALWPVIFM